MPHFPLVAVALWLSLLAPPVDAQAAPRATAAPAKHNDPYVLQLPTHRERPAHRVALTLGGSYPASASLNGHATVGLAPLTAARLTVSGLWRYDQGDQKVRQRVQPVLLLGPALVFDAFRYVPHVFVQAGLALVPAAPVVVMGASIEQFFSRSWSAQASLLTAWQGHVGWRIEAQMGLSFAGL